MSAGTASAALCAVAGLALYAGHHVGDYWVQTDAQARLKGTAGWAGRLACLEHVLTYLATQLAMLLLAWWALGLEPIGWSRMLAALAVSGVTHWLADRREHGLMFWLARRLPGKATFLTLGKPRPMIVEVEGSTSWQSQRVALDQPTLATGPWALDQAWHLFFGVFIPALIIAS